MVYDNARIARHYLHGWFFLDVFTVVPFDIIFFVITDAADVTIDATNLRLLRMLRCLKLVRIIRASRVIARWQDHVSVSFALVSLVRFCVLIFILAHWLACLWGFVGLKWSELDLTDDQRSTLAAAGLGSANTTQEALEGGLSVAAEWAGYHTHMSWRQKARVSDSANEYELYGICIYVALNNVRPRLAARHSCPPCAPLSIAPWLR